MESQNNQKNNKNIDKFENKVVFNNNDRYRFVFKKQERLVAALYLITHLFSDQEPLKWKIREQSLIALTQSLELTRAAVDARSRIVADCARALSELVALCDIAHIAKYISDMNHIVLGREFAVVLETLEAIVQEGTTENGSVLSNEFFSVTVPSLVKKTQNTNKGHDVLYTQNPESDLQRVGIGAPIKDMQKEARIKKILGMLEVSKTLSIKDFSGVIQDCSEKTIQRELLSLVDGGVIKKTGERRWSMYSLK